MDTTDYLASELRRIQGERNRLKVELVHERDLIARALELADEWLLSDSPSLQRAALDLRERLES